MTTCAYEGCQAGGVILPGAPVERVLRYGEPVELPGGSRVTPIITEELFHPECRAAGWCEPDECPASICNGPHVSHTCENGDVVTVRFDNVEPCPFCGRKP